MSKEKKIKIKPGDYEGFSYGPLKIERIGRVVQLSSDWDPKEHKKFIKKLISGRPKLKQGIDGSIAKLLGLISTYNPFHLMPVVSFHNLFGDPEEFKESTFEGKEVNVEYPLSLILSQKKVGVKEPTEKIIKHFEDLIKDALEKVRWYFLTEDAVNDQAKDKTQEVRKSSLLDNLFVRGKSFPQHHIQIVKDLYSPFDDIFESKFGFKVEQFCQFYNSLETQLNKNTNDLKDFYKTLHELHDMFKSFAKDSNFSSEEELKKAYHELPEVIKKKKILDQFDKDILENHFMVKPQDKLEEKLFDLITSELGSNSAFLTPPQWLGWPTNDSIIYDKPLIKYENKYYLFAPQILFRNLPEVLDNLLQSVQQSYSQARYENIKSNYLEKSTLEYLNKLLPKAEVYGKLYYKNESGQRCETDGIILHDTNLFIVEAKGDFFSKSSKRGSLKGLKHDLEKIVEEAYTQALRTKKYIESKDIPIFEYADGKVALEITNKKKFKNIYLINSTLDALGPISAQLNSLRAFNFLAENQWIWTVFINDLKTVSDLIESPSEFMLYLQRRLRVNDFEQLKIYDELDYLMVFFNEGLYFEDGIIDLMQRVTYSGYTDDLNRYYDFLAGVVSSGDKPSLKIKPEYRQLVDQVEQTDKEGSTEIGCLLLGLDSPSQEKILTTIEHAKKLYTIDFKNHDFTLEFETFGITFVISGNQNVLPEGRFDGYCNLKLYSLRITKWYLIAIIISGSEYKVDFKIYEKEWQEDPELEKQLEGFRKNKWDHLKRTGQKIGRNDPCFCGSRKKYKKCCYLRGLS